MREKKKIVIIGGGPSGLFCAYHLLNNGFPVDLYDHSSGPAKKFLVAGNGGLNLTHSERADIFAGRYGKDTLLFKNLLEEFSPNDLRNWCMDLGVETFVGTSGRVFPKKLNAAEILINWTKKLHSFENFNLYLKHKLTGVTRDKTLTFKAVKGEITIKTETLILAMGGASWKKTGSDGLWANLLSPIGIDLAPFLPMNCGFERPWSDYFISQVDRAPLKNIAISFEKISVRGEVMLTPFGLEGGAIYALSNLIRDEIIKNKSATVSIDLSPDLTLEKVIDKLKKRKKKISMSHHLRKTFNFDKKTFILLKEVLSQKDFDNPKILGQKIKKLEVEFFNTRPIDEAISTSGGVRFSGLNENMESKIMPGTYFAGEMLDFEAPTGGYLLQGCFSTAWMVLKGILQ